MGVYQTSAEHYAGRRFSLLAEIDCFVQLFLPGDDDIKMAKKRQPVSCE